MAVVRSPFCGNCSHERTAHNPDGCSICECPNRAPNQVRRSDGSVSESWGNTFAPKFEKGNQLAVRHGVDSLVQRRSVIPAATQAEVEAQIVVVRSEVQKYREDHGLVFVEDVDEPEFRRLAKLDVIARNIESYIDSVLAGEATVIIRNAPKGSPNTGPEALFSTELVKTYLLTVKAASDISERLGLNPAGRYKLLKDAGWAKHLAGDRVGELVRRGRALREARTA